jgi:hypothetical protein
MKDPVLTDWGYSCSSREDAKFLAQSKGGDPIKNETIQSSVASLTHLL